MVVHTIPPGMLFFQIVWHVYHNSGNIMDCNRTWHKEMGEHDLSRTCGFINKEKNESFSLNHCDEEV